MLPSPIPETMSAVVRMLLWRCAMTSCKICEGRGLGLEGEEGESGLGLEGEEGERGGGNSNMLCGRQC